MTEGKAFFDTNVLLYMYAGSEERKQARSRQLFRDYALSERLLVSTQVVQEFFVAGSRKMGIGGRKLRRIVNALLDLPLGVIQAEQIRLAMDATEHYGISFWDALIVAAAASGGPEILYTEDLNNGQRYGGVLARNPFAAD